MSGASQRKGRAAELELVKLLRGYGYDVRPGEAQSYGREPDLSGLPGIHAEVKRCEQLRLSSWMKQATADAARFRDGFPVIFHRKNREPWLVTLHLDNFILLYNRALTGDCGRSNEGDTL